MSKIRVGNRFFKRARTEYNDWRSATIRELAQNSQDAGASRIDISVVGVGSSSLLTWRDDGRGMDRDVLENVFFALGETSKKGTDTGGYGKARELTCFSMERYSIRTRNLLVEGAGDEYTIDDRADAVQGCVFEILVDIEVGYLESVIRSYFAMSNPLCAVYLNDAQVESFADIGSHRRDLSFGSVFVNDKIEAHRCIIRVNGLCMFSRYIESPVQVFVNLDASRSRVLMTSNRDGLSGYDVHVEFDRFINELSVDIKSAIRQRHGLKTGVIDGRQGVIQSRKKSKNTVESSGSVQGSFSMSASLSIPVIRDNQKFLDMLATPPEENRIDMFSVYVCDETQDEERFQKMRSVRDAFDPRNWRLAYTKGPDGTNRPYHIGGNRKKLLFYWKTACEICIEILQDMGDLLDVSWSVGWLFVDDRGACCIQENGNHFYCLCPVGMDGKMLYSLTDEEDLHKIVWMALHEVAHTCERSHNETFASILTRASPRVSVGMRAIIAAMKSSAVSAVVC